MGRVEVEVKPSGKRSAVTGYDPWRGAFRVEVRAPPVKGRANSEVEEILAELLLVRRASVRVVGGATSRHKVVEVEGLSDEEISSRLKRACGEY
ncbi:YggU family protein [Thermoplasmatales archaeon ex4484_36]|nr:MAG: YggU family protein [Thermoplasmatales archaeon ex4484_36]RLF70050.1 MAG: YggU family protein [Thermoplasmata archaeon]HDD59492.1 YggU family protein [Euryarchaeota archaeon]RLF70748.1 MAG: YggU family protein [Thermoplasmata archaeon]RLF73160.1 MAG: YggU family protein [Thermoplasmata archaeon]